MGGKKRKYGKKNLSSQVRKYYFVTKVQPFFGDDHCFKGLEKSNIAHERQIAHLFVCHFGLNIWK